MSEFTHTSDAPPHAARETACCAPSVLAHLRQQASEGTTADVRLLAKLVLHRAHQDDLSGLGLSAAQFAALGFWLLEGTDLEPFDAPARLLPDELRDYQGNMQALLWDFRADARPETAWLACIVATACLRPDHLWRDLGLAGRVEVTDMLTRHFPQLVARNTLDLRWKKFLAYQLCERQGLPPRPAPGCAGCEDHGFCYPGAG